MKELNSYYPCYLQQLLLPALTDVIGINSCCFQLPFWCVWD